MTALGLGGLGRRPITVSVFPDFHPAQVAWGMGTILRRCPTACPGDVGQKAVKHQLPTLILKQTQAQHLAQSTEANWELPSNSTVRSLGDILLALTIHLPELSGSSLPC